jgi:hypothetical protein
MTQDVTKNPPRLPKCSRRFDEIRSFCTVIARPGQDAMVSRESTKPGLPDT